MVFLFILDKDNGGREFEFYFGLILRQLQTILCAISQRKEMSISEGKSLAMKTMKTLNKSKTALSFALNERSEPSTDVVSEKKT